MIFWAYSPIVVDRALPIMIKLKERGVKSVLLYQDYKFPDDCPVHKRIINKYNLIVKTYGDYIYKGFLPQKPRLLKYYITEKVIQNIFSDLSPRINIFDTIQTDADYPAGSRLINSISKKLNIPSIAIPHGVRIYYKDMKPKKIYIFDKIISCNKKMKEYIDNLTDSDNIILGDPRFDLWWRKELLELKPARILYLFPSLETLGLVDQQLTIFFSILRTFPEDTEIFVRLHPRWTIYKKILKKYTQIKFIDQSPLIYYVDYVDYVITPGTSLLFDILPEHADKIIIYDPTQLENIFSGHLRYFKSLIDLRTFIKNPTPHKKNTKLFYERHICDGTNPTQISTKIAELILSYEQNNSCNSSS